MTKPILYGMMLSPPVRACLMTAAEIGLDIEYREINLFKGEHMSEEYLKKNPRHTIPMLEIDGKYICDSHAIMTFLVGKYAKNDKLYPKDLYERALVDEKLHYDSNTLVSRAGALNGPIIRRKRSSVPQELCDSLYEAFDVLEQFLTKNEWMAGKHMTLADISFCTTMTAATILCPLKPENHSKTMAWMKRMQALPYYEEKCGKPGQVLVDLVRNSLGEMQAAEGKL